MQPRSADYLRAIASGLLLAFSFPEFGHPALAWIALTPLLVCLTHGTLRRAFSLGLVSGLVYFSGTLYWISRVMVVYGDVQMWLAVPINIALIAYLALFPAVFALVVRRLTIAHGPRALMTSPLVWVATELGRTHLFTGFPWVLLGYSQVTVLPIAQFASVFGVYGVSMLVAAVGASLAELVVLGPIGDGRLRVRGQPAVAGPALVAIVVVALAVWGSRRAAARDWTHAGVPIRVGLIQGNVDQAIKWDPQRASAIFEDYMRLTRDAIARGAQFILWPESSTPFLFEEDHVEAERVRDLARQSHVPLLFGSDQVEWKIAGGRRVVDKYFNAAFLVGADGRTAGVYRKMHLVPFGEYVPLQRLLFFAAPLTEQVGTFTPGDNPELLPVDGHPASVAICYEVVYPSLVREFVRAGSQLLTTITNDAWFGDTSAPVQHFEQASMRAIEEGRYLVRSANTGISGIVDPYGHVLVRTAIFEPAVAVGDARFLTTSTFYARHGDILAYASVLTVAALLLMSRRRVQ